MKPRCASRESTRRIEEERAAFIINYLIEKFLDDHSAGAILTLLYIWIALHTAFAGIRTTVKQILGLYIPSPIKSKFIQPAQQSVPIMKGKTIYFKKKELPLPDELYNILDAIVDGRSEKPLFENVQTTIENYLQEATRAAIQVLKIKAVKQPHKQR
jgi:hypothetical protein